MNILLVYPEFPDTFWSFKHALAFVGKKAALPPLGLLTVAALLPRSWNVRLVDLNVRPLSRADLAWANMAFVSAMAVQRAAAQAAMARLRAAGLRVVAGGPLFTADPGAFPEADHLVLNEAELTLPPFLADLAAGRPQRIYASADHADLAASPVPVWGLLDFRSYACMSIQFSRGCPFDCDFCNITALLGRRVRTKTAACVLGELDALAAAGWNGEVFFVDDNFIGNRSFLKKELLPALAEWRERHPGFLFYTEASIDLADDPELTAAMVDAGFYKVFIGIETPEEASLSECGKRQNRNRDLVQDVKRLQRAGLQVQGGFIVGFDHDPPSIFQRQIDFIQASGIATAMVGLLQAPPGTRLFNRLKGEGRVTHWLSGDNVDGSTNIVPRMSLPALKAGYRRILDTIYAPGPYYERIRTFLKEAGTPKFRGRLHLHHVKAAVKALVRLGLLEEGRREFWRLVWWTQRHRPRLLPDAIILAVTGYHFRKVCEKARVAAE